MCFPMRIKVKVLARLVYKSLFILEVAGNIKKNHMFHGIVKKKKKYHNPRGQHSSVKGSNPRSRRPELNPRGCY